MSVVIILIAASLTVALGFLAAFIWSVKSGQYDDDYTPSVRMLFDEAPTPQVKISHTERSRSVSGDEGHASTTKTILRQDDSPKGVPLNMKSHLKNTKPTK